MSLVPTLAERAARARSDLRVGLPVVIDGHLAAAVETLTPARLAALRALGKPALALTDRRAETLKARAYDGDLARVEVPGTRGSRGIAGVARSSYSATPPSIRAGRYFT